MCIGIFFDSHLIIHLFSIQFDVVMVKFMVKSTPVV